MTAELATAYVQENGILDSDDHLQVRELWEGRYRVNVWKYNPNKIVQSFFVRTNESGVVDCNPSLGA